MILKRSQANQTVEIGPLMTSGSPITSGASVFVNNVAGNGTLVHRAIGVWAYTFTQAETAASIVTLRVQSTGLAAIVANFSTHLADIETLINQVLAKTNLIGTGSATTSTPVTPTGIINPITIGDDYLAIHSRVFEWTVDKPAGFNLTDAVCWFGAELDNCNKWRVSGSIVDNGDDTLTLTFELPKEKTKSLKPGNYDWSVAVHDVTGNEITKVKSGTNSVTLSKKFTSATS